MTSLARHTGSSFDAFLEEDGILEEVDAITIKRVIAWRIKQEMAARRISRKAMAERLQTNRIQIDRLLDPESAAVHLTTLMRAAREVALRLSISVEHISDAVAAWLALAFARMR